MQIPIRYGYDDGALSCGEAAKRFCSVLGDEPRIDLVDAKTGGMSFVARTSDASQRE